MSPHVLRARPASLLPAFALTLAVALAVPAAAAAQDTEPQEDSARAETGSDLPLEPARWLRMTTDQGTWISVDVSPDGQTLVFDLLGDLYTMPLSGGTAMRLTEGLPFDAQPRFSPDGNRIVFVSDRSGGENLWTIAPDGSDTTQVTSGNDNLYTSPEWTPDGEYLVASRTYGPLGGEAKLWMFHIDGGSGAELTPEPENMKALGAAFGPDPRYIWFARANSDWQYNASLPRYQVHVYDRETGGMTEMTDRYGSGFRPAVSPDGRWLVYGSRYEDQTGLRRRDLETGEEAWLVYPVHRDDQEARATLDALPGYAFTPDSREVVVTLDGGLWRVPIEGGAPRRIPFTVDLEVPMGPEVRFEYRVDDDPTFVVRQIRDAVPSPDGSRLALTALDRLYVARLDADDPAPEPLGDADGQFHPAWSPDGQWIAYVTWSESDGGHLWRIPAAGGPPEQLTETPALYSQPAWSPDGERIVAIRSPGRELLAQTSPAGSELVWIPSAGGVVETVAPAAGRSAPHFVADEPDRIYAYGPDGLVSFRWDGTDEEAYLEVTGATRQGASSPLDADVILMSPVGGRALALVEDHAYLVTVPWTGGETPSVSVNNPERAAFPARRLTEVGGQFPAWSADGASVHWSIGNAHFVYDIARADAVADSLDALGDDAPDDAAYEPAESRIEIEATRDIPEGVAVLRGARVVTMQDDEVFEDAEVVIRDNRIASVGPMGSVEVPAGAEVIDVSGATIVPGFIDAHAHLRPPGGVHTTYPWQYVANLAYGVTTTRDPQTGSTDVLSYADMVERGAFPGPRIYSTGPGVFGDYRGAAIGSQEDATRLLTRYSEYYGTRYFRMYLAGNREARQWLITAARELGLMPTTEGGIDFKLDLTHAMDGYPGIEHNMPIYPAYQDVVRLIVESGVLYTPTLLVAFGGPQAENYWFATEDAYNQPKLRRFTPYDELAERTRRRGAGWFMPEEHVFGKFGELLADIVEEDGRVGVGGHGQLQGLGWHWELWNVQSGGMSEHDALRAATVLAAEGLGMAQDLGTVEGGKMADMVVLNANPLDDIRNTTSIRYVIKNGRIYDGDTLDEIWPRQRPLERPSWFGQPPRPFATDQDADDAGGGSGGGS